MKNLNNLRKQIKKRKIILISLVFLLGIAVGYSWGLYKAYVHCIDTGIKVLDIQIKPEYWDLINKLRLIG